jgi:hypothetical protein
VAKDGGVDAKRVRQKAGLPSRLGRQPFRRLGQAVSVYCSLPKVRMR